MDNVINLVEDDGRREQPLPERLADLDLYSPMVQVRAYSIPSMYHIDEQGDDHYAATRRAIVRAAAEIGRAMK